MKSDAKMKMTIDRAKRTRLGRFFCRLAGEERGAVMMEYVVLGVMVVAAVVALVMLFGKQIRASFEEMIRALMGKPQPVVVLDEDDISDANSTGESITTDGESATEVGQ